MIDKLLEGKLLTLLVGSVFRLVEIVVRTIHITVRGIRLAIQDAVTSPIDRWIAATGKRRLAENTPVDDTSVVLIQADGEYTGEPKYIAEEILRRGGGTSITWVLRDQSVGPFPREFDFVRYGTARYFRAVAGAKVVIQDGPSLEASDAAKGPHRHWIRASNGSVASAVLEPSLVEQTAPRRDRSSGARRIDTILTNSAPTAGASAVGPTTLALGHARNDLLFDTSPETAAAVRKKVLTRLGIVDAGQRFLLYAPTRQRSAATAALSGIDIPAVRAALAAAFGGTWEILIRTHQPGKAASDILLAGLPASCHNASFHPDAQELLALADAGLTDAAGWICDYLLTAKPAFLFAAQRPGQERVLDGTPFTVARSSRELVEDIQQFDRERYEDRIARFLDVHGNADDGAAASRIVDRLEELLAR